MLAAILLDGIPENLALGVVLIGASLTDVAALAAAIVLSNFPESMGSAEQMRSAGIAKPKALLIWVITTCLLAAATFIGYFTLYTQSAAVIAYIMCFAAGAVVSSLAVEIFSKAFQQDNTLAGIAVAIGVIMATILETF